jgi:hypothetical protein
MRLRIARWWRALWTHREIREDVRHWIEWGRG